MMSCFGENTIMILLQPPSYQIRRSLRARRMRIVIRPGHIELVAPVSANQAEICDFFHRHRDWAQQKSEQLDARAGSIGAQLPARLETGGKIPFQGRKVSLLIRQSSQPRPGITFDDDGFLISIPAKCGGQQAERLARRTLLSWLKLRLQAEAHAIIQQHAGRHALYPRGVRIRTMNTRWGSLGIHNDMNLNLRLILAPPSVLEYVVVHELCHIRHRDHSRRFWSLVARHLPQYAAERSWLRAHGDVLMTWFDERSPR